MRKSHTARAVDREFYICRSPSVGSLWVGVGAFRAPLGFCWQQKWGVDDEKCGWTLGDHQDEAKVMEGCSKTDCGMFQQSRK